MEFRTMNIRRNKKDARVMAQARVEQASSALSYETHIEWRADVDHPLPSLPSPPHSCFIVEFLGNDRKKKNGLKRVMARA
jgi:hypothetical protein